MNLQQLRYVAAVADHGTMTAAAKHLYVSQPALSRAVRELEQELGLVLFARQGRTVVIEPGAVGVIRAARSAVAAADDVRRAARSVARPRVFCSSPGLSALLSHRLMPALGRLGLDRPVRVVHAGGAEEIEAQVLAGEADVGLIVRPPSPGLVGISLGREEVVLVSPADVVLPDPVPLTALDGARMIVPPPVPRPGAGVTRSSRPSGSARTSCWRPRTRARGRTPCAPGSVRSCRSRS